jgi:small subunit ribosomal protein S17
VVVVDRLKEHPKYHKRFKVSKKFKAHDENKEYREGDVVVIEECRPLSRDKRFKVVKKVSSGKKTEKIEAPAEKPQK